MRGNILMVLLVIGAAGAYYFYTKGKPTLASTLPATQVSGLPAEFSARVAELDALAETVGRDSPTYKAAIDQAYIQVAGQLSQGEVVGWSSAKGYYRMTAEEARLIVL